MRWLYLIADFSYKEETLAAVLDAGVDFILLRDKQFYSADYLKLA